MVYNGIYINSDNLIQLAYKIKNKIKELQSCYDSITTRMREIDGTTETWQGIEQKKYYDTLTYLTNKYALNINKMIEFYNFLCKVIIDYEKRDETFGKDLDRNAENLDM